MTKIIKNLKVAKDLIENKYNYNTEYYYKFRQIYPFTTQNLKAQYKFFDLKDKDILTVQGSGDQVIELLLNGATNIDAFDINPLTEYYTDLKLAAFRARVSKQEYLDFFRYNDYPIFGQDNNRCFNYETFNKIKDFLNPECHEFWIKLFATYEPQQIRRKNYLFSMDEARESVFENILNYYEEDKFKKLYTLVNKLEYQYIKSDIRQIPKILNKQYDFIDLSNIIQYADIMWSTQPLEHYRKLMDQLIPFLKPNGSLIIGYIYQLQTECINSECYQKSIRDMYFPPSEYEYYCFDGMYDIKYKPQKRDNDAILVYHKR